MKSIGLFLFFVITFWIDVDQAQSPGNKSSTTPFGNSNSNPVEPVLRSSTLRAQKSVFVGLMPIGLNVTPASGFRLDYGFSPDWLLGAFKKAKRARFWKNDNNINLFLRTGYYFYEYL